MIVQYILLGVVYTLQIIFFWLPTVSVLPTIGGFDIDTYLVQGVGYFKTYSNAVWPVHDVFLGFLALLSWYTLKMILKFVLGHRAPGTH